MPRPKPPAMESPTVEVMEDSKTVLKKERELRRLDKEIRKEFWYLESWMRRNPGLVFQRWELESPSFRTYIEWRKVRIKEKYREFQTILGVKKDHDGDWSIEKEISRVLKATLERERHDLDVGDGLKKQRTWG